MLSQQFKEAAVAACTRVEMDTATACGTFLYTAIIVVLNIKEEARVGLKTASAHCSSMSSVNSVDDDGFELLLGMRSSLLWPTL